LDRQVLLVSLVQLAFVVLQDSRGHRDCRDLRERLVRLASLVLQDQLGLLEEQDPRVSFTRERYISKSNESCLSLTTKIRWLVFIACVA